VRCGERVTILVAGAARLRVEPSACSSLICASAVNGQQASKARMQRNRLFRR
jgi:hypothetical protein